MTCGYSNKSEAHVSQCIPRIASNTIVRCLWSSRWSQWTRFRKLRAVFPRCKQKYRRGCSTSGRSETLGARVRRITAENNDGGIIRSFCIHTARRCRPVVTAVLEIFSFASCSRSFATYSHASLLGITFLRSAWIRNKTRLVSFKIVWHTIVKVVPDKLIRGN